MVAKSKGVSVIICSYNGEKVIAETLEHILKQKVRSSTDWEILLVDNNSTDDTVKKAEQLWNDSLCPAPFRIIDQPKRGLLNARKKGVEAARFEYVLYCDDDNWLNSDYVEKTYEIMESNPQIGILGGKGRPFFEKSKPSWFNTYEKLYACGPQAKKTGEVTKKKYVYGAGSVYRKSVLSNLFPYAIIACAQPQKSRGDDVILGLIHVIAGYKIFYDERLTFRHYISKERANYKYLLKLKWYNGIEDVYLRPITDHINKKETVKKKFNYISIKFMHLLSAIKHSFVNLLNKKILIQKTLSITRNLSSIISMITLNKSYKAYTDEVNELIYRIKRESEFDKVENR